MLSLTKRLSKLISITSLCLIPIGAAAECPNILKHTFSRLQDNKPLPLCQFEGKGSKVSAFGSMTKPDNKELLNKIEEFLK